MGIKSVKGVQKILVKIAQKDLLLEGACTAQCSAHIEHSMKMWSCKSLHFPNFLLLKTKIGNLTSFNISICQKLHLSMWDTLSSKIIDSKLLFPIPQNV